MSGYFCFAKSNNALTAESNERYPLSRASKIMSKKLGWTLAKGGVGWWIVSLWVAGYVKLKAYLFKKNSFIPSDSPRA
jgi:hypothetical protein